jgi:hypothetical protein
LNNIDGSSKIDLPPNCFLFVKQVSGIMALPTKSKGGTLDFIFIGLPYNPLPAKSTIDLFTIDFMFINLPFVSNNAPAESAFPVINVLFFAGD